MSANRSALPDAPQGGAGWCKRSDTRPGDAWQGCQPCQGPLGPRRFPVHPPSRARNLGAAGMISMIRIMIT